MNNVFQTFHQLTNRVTDHLFLVPKQTLSHESIMGGDGPLPVRGK